MKDEGAREGQRSHRDCTPERSPIHAQEELDEDKARNVAAVQPSVDRDARMARVGDLAERFGVEDVVGAEHEDALQRYRKA